MADTDRHLANRILLGGLAGFVAASLMLIIGTLVQPEADISSFFVPRGYWGIIGFAIFGADRAYVRFRMKKPLIGAPAKPNCPSTTQPSSLLEMPE